MEFFWVDSFKSPDSCFVWKLNDMKFNYFITPKLIFYTCRVQKVIFFCQLKLSNKIFFVNKTLYFSQKYKHCTTMFKGFWPADFSWIIITRPCQYSCWHVYFADFPFQFLRSNDMRWPVWISASLPQKYLLTLIKDWLSSRLNPAIHHG